MMAQQQCVLKVRPLVVEIAPLRRGAVSQEQRHAVGEPLLHRGAQQIVKSRLFPKSPREQQFKPAVVAQEVHVVKRLLVVWIGTRFEQKLDERARLRVWRRRNRTCLPDANRTRDGRVPYLAHEGVRPRIRTPVEQKARACERVPGLASCKACIADVKQRIPIPWSTAPGNQVGITLEMLPQCADVAKGRRHISVLLRKTRECRQDRLCLFSSLDGVVLGVRKASEI